MGKSTFKKTDFHKLYLIDQETYNRVLAQLTELEQQDLEELNQENSLNIDSKDDTSDTKSETVEMNSESTEKIESNASQIETGVKESLKEVSELQAIEETKPLKNKKMKPKRFACSICITKQFTTKSSLKRHHKLFHEAGQAIKVKDDTLETEAKVDDELPLSRGLKRKTSENFSEQRADKRFRGEPRGVKRKAPVRQIDVEPRKKFHWASYS